ncbi:hypothetical protein DFP72DRAFT_1076500 [Ephemerocybe angulata]|uniref:Uncharacterized protein n=1 Tax=Ephemerocybe angulata TaxID=980116 RepID=A0A8H6HFZ3_9AGAR|nr:hypothetical protein DFP72DRAFT_1076500 [Tulosesus angulatus]
MSYPSSKITKEDFTPLEMTQIQRVDPSDYLGPEYDLWVIGKNHPIQQSWASGSRGWYVVTCGRFMGITDNWGAASHATSHYSGQAVQSCISYEHARSYWEHALLTGNWGSPLVVSEGTKLEPFEGWIVGGLDDRKANDLRRYAQRLSEYLAQHPEAIVVDRARPLSYWDQYVAASKKSHRGAKSAAVPQSSLGLATSSTQGPLPVTSSLTPAGNASGASNAFSTKTGGINHISESQVLPGSYGRSKAAAHGPGALPSIPFSSLQISDSQTGPSQTKSTSKGKGVDRGEKVDTQGFSDFLPTTASTVEADSGGDGWWVVVKGRLPGVVFGKSVAKRCGGGSRRVRIVGPYPERSAYLQFVHLYQAKQLEFLED